VHVSGKEIEILSSIKLGLSDKICYVVLLKKFATNPVNVFNVNWIKSLHYFVKLKMLILKSCYRKTLRNLSHLNCARPPNSPDLNPGVPNTHYWSGRTKTATENGTGQAGSRRLCSSSSSVFASDIVSIHISDACFVHLLIIQTWRI